MTKRSIPYNSIHDGRECTQIICCTTESRNFDDDRKMINTPSIINTVHPKAAIHFGSKSVCDLSPKGFMNPKKNPKKYINDGIVIRASPAYSSAHASNRSITWCNTLNLFINLSVLVCVDEKVDSEAVRLDPFDRVPSVWGHCDDGTEKDEFIDKCVASLIGVSKVSYGPSFCSMDLIVAAECKLKSEERVCMATAQTRMIVFRWKFGIIYTVTEHLHSIARMYAAMQIALSVPSDAWIHCRRLRCWVVSLNLNTVWLW